MTVREQFEEDFVLRHQKPSGYLQRDESGEYAKDWVEAEYQAFKAGWQAARRAEPERKADLSRGAVLAKKLCMVNLSLASAMNPDHVQTMREIHKFLLAEAPQPQEQK